MNKKELEKNVLDLAYRKQLNYLNAVLAVGTIGILSFIGTFIWNKESLKLGFILTTAVILLCYAAYKKLDKNMKEISNKIRKL